MSLDNHRNQDRKNAGALTMREAHRQLLAIKPLEYDVNAYTRIGIAVSVVSMCAGISFIAWGLLGREGWWVVQLMDLATILTAQILMLVSLWKTAKALWRARDGFFESLEDRAAKDEAVIDGLARNGLAWVKEWQLRLKKAVDAQVVRTTFLRRRILSGGALSSLASYLLSLRLQLPDFDMTDPKIWAVAFLAGTFMGLLLVNSHQRTSRELLTLLQVARQRLETREKLHA